ncbi:MAG: pstB2 [Acidobacteria bacterium]|nr:pstB2 [Acidobacteriota bacterium]
MNTTPAFRVSSLAHAYDGTTVLDVPHLEVPAGEICALVGPNGSGKTTLLSILAVLLKPRCGSVLLRGVETAGVPEGERQRLRRQVTLIHQKPVLFSTTVRRNISYGLRATGVAARDVKARVDRALVEFGIAELADRQARRLSGGEAQRVVLARGLVLETPVLLLDEPTSFLDDDFRPMLFDFLRAANRSRGVTILLATHDSSLVSALAHRIIRMEKGKVSSVETGRQA